MGNLPAFCTSPCLDEHYCSLCEALVMLPGLTVSFAEGQLSPQPAHQGDAQRHRQRQTGIVHEVASILRQLNINVADLTTGCEPAPHSRRPLFYAHAPGPCRRSSNWTIRHGPGVPLRRPSSTSIRSERIVSPVITGGQWFDAITRVDANQSKEKAPDEHRQVV